ncbi:MAG: hypothetical protein ABF238_03080, partial [Flavobacteriales bacterium]
PLVLVCNEYPSYLFVSNECKLTIQLKSQNHSYLSFHNPRYTCADTSVNAPISLGTPSAIAKQAPDIYGLL